MAKPLARKSPYATLEDAIAEVQKDLAEYEESGSTTQAKNCENLLKLLLELRTRRDGGTRTAGVQ
jgi:hypothetical protein